MGRNRKNNKTRPLWAERLEAHRFLSGLTQGDFAAKLGMSQQRYGSYETGRTQPNIETWIKISDELKKTIDDIVRGDVNAQAPEGPNAQRTSKQHKAA